MNGMSLSGELRIQTVTELVTQLFEEPEFNKPRPAAQTQTISIPKQHSTKGPAPEPAPAKKPDRMSRRQVFVIVAVLKWVFLWFLN